MKAKLNEIKNFKELYNYIGSEFAQDKSGLELLIEGYKKAKQKGYIKDNKKHNMMNNRFNDYRMYQRGQRNQYGYRNNYGQQILYQNNQMRDNFGYGYINFYPVFSNQLGIRGY